MHVNGCVPAVNKGACMSACMVENMCDFHFDGLVEDYSTVKPVSNDHLYGKIYHLWFIQ